MMSQKALVQGRPVAASRVRPFTAGAVAPVSVRRVIARVAEAEAAEFEPLVLDEDTTVERVVLGEDAREAARVAEELMASYTLEAVVEAGLDGASQEAASKASALLDDGLDAARGALSADLSEAAALAAVGSEALAVDVEDVVGAAGFRKYDEEDGPVYSADVLNTVQRLKLTRQELSNLVPKDWANVQVDWFSNKKEENIPLPEYKLTFLWQRDNLAVAVDQVYSRGQTSPLTEFFVWPRKDAWDELRVSLETRSWISERDRVLLLNRLTDVINYWQDSDSPEKKTIEEARAKFPDCAFA